MLRGIHKASSNWLGRVVMGVLLGLIAISFGIWGIGDIFRGFGQSTVAKVGGTEIRVDTFRQIYQDRLQQLSRQMGRPITPDQARRARPRPPDARPGDRGNRARRARPRAQARHHRRRSGAPASLDDQSFRGINGQFDRTRFEYADPADRLHRAALPGRAAPQHAAPATGRHRQRRSWPCPRPRSTRSTASATSSAPSTT